jgi:hypothetical protein
MQFGSVVDAVYDPSESAYRHGGTVRTSSLIGATHYRYAGEHGCQAIMVVQSPESTIRPHFHPADQFQVIARGSGALGRHLVEPFDLHYADQGTPYGPIRPKPTGLSYVTLRPSHTDETYYMPESRGAAARRFGRSIFARYRPASDEPSQVVIERQPDGLGASAFQVSAGDHVTCPSPRLSGGQFVFVAHGSVRCGARTLSELSVIFVEPSDSPLVVTGDAETSHLIVMDFPSGESAPIVGP